MEISQILAPFTSVKHWRFPGSLEDAWGNQQSYDHLVAEILTAAHLFGRPSQANLRNIYILRL